MSKTILIDFKAVKVHVDFLDVLSHYGIDSRGSGKQIKINCPFHKDYTLSCGVNLDRGLFNCFSCLTGSHVIDSVLPIESMNPNDATDRQKAAHLMGRSGEMTSIQASRKEPNGAAAITRAICGLRTEGANGSEGPNAAIAKSRGNETFGGPLATSAKQFEGQSLEQWQLPFIFTFLSFSLCGRTFAAP